jgi:hypothetical protein
MPQGDRTGPQSQGPKPEKTRGNVVLKADPPHRKNGAAEVEARDQAEVPAGVRAKAEAPDKAAAGSLNQLTN